MSCKYLKKEDIDLSDIDLTSDFPLITPSMGAGKTYAVINGYIKEAFERKSGRKINFQLLVTPTKSLRNDVLEQYGEGAVTPLCEADFLCPNDGDTRVRVACISQIGKFLQNGNVIEFAPDLIVFDELDEIAQWTLCHADKLPVFDWVFSNRDKMLACGITATPQLLTGYVNGSADVRFVDITPDFPINHTCDEIKIYEHMMIDTLLKSIEPKEDSKVLVYTRSAKKCFQLSRAFPDSGFLISTYNDELDKNTGKQLNELMAEQVFQLPNGFGSMSLLDYLNHYQILPQGVNILFINDAYSAGINIRDEAIKTVVVESVDVATIKQVRGRVRHNISSLLIAYNYKEKKNFLRNLERAERFFSDETNLEEWHLAEQTIIRECEANNERIPIDILTYRSCDGEAKVNPFAFGFYHYQIGIYSKLADKIGRSTYFHSLLPYSKDRRVSFASDQEKDAIRADGANKLSFRNFDLTPYIGRKLFTEDKEHLALDLGLVDTQRHPRRWTTVKRFLEGEGFTVESKGSKAINPHTGKRQTYSIISDPKK